jgi:hypothetical protein
LCSATDIILLTGCISGDFQATPTFKARSGTQPSRLDHALVSRSCLPLVLSSRVDSTRLESDHFPLEVCLSLPRIPGHRPVFSGMPLPSRVWKHAFRDPYATALSLSLLLSPMLAPLPDPALLSSAFFALDTLVLNACTSAGMPPRQSHTATHTSAPFYDAECVSSKRRYRAALRRRDPDPKVHALERVYHSLVRRKRRAYQLQRLHQLLQDQRDNPRQFWKLLRHAATDLPLSLLDTQAWDPYLTHLCNLTPLHTPVLPDSAYPPQSQPLCAPMNSPLTLTEISSGLTRLHNGRSSATSGLLAELYRYAQATPTPEAPSPPHLLAPVLLHLLNSAYMHGHVPPLPIWPLSRPFSTKVIVQTLLLPPYCSL